MILGLAQMQIAWEDKQSNKKCVRDLVEAFAGMCKQMTDEEVSATSPDTSFPLLAFPEMTLTGFSMNTSKTRDDEEETISFCRELANTYQIAIGIGRVVRSEGDALCENRYTIVAPPGVLLDYAKLHPFSYAGETEYFKGGNHLGVCEMDDFHIGCAICYDLRFPELFRRLADEAELVLVPANWPAERSHHWRILLAARAVENRCYVAGVNCVGETGGLHYSGDSGLYGPDGSLLEPKHKISNGENEASCILVYEISNNIQKLRDEFPVLKDKHPEDFIHMKIEKWTTS
ncbi:MAG: nitrilase-related carbon-nitrogen hydrolase [Eubacteriales bacterium]|nr:carbon-nitrogen family hydrolase [Lachnospiraceae bacterium]MDO5126612.1 nitrilase-related carbon-nitrogen hydrolase [Eubacteriales bacterium]